MALRCTSRMTIRQLSIRCLANCCLLTNCCLLLPTATNHCYLLPLTVVTWQCVIKIIDESELAFLASFAPAYRSTQACWHHLELSVCREYMLQQPTSLLLRVAGLYQVRR